MDDRCEETWLFQFGQWVKRHAMTAMSGQARRCAACMLILACIMHGCAQMRQDSEAQPEARVLPQEKSAPDKPALLPGSETGPAPAQPAMSLESFEDVTKEVGLEGLGNGPAFWVDFDNDGHVDLYVSGRLYRNLEGQRFEEVKDSGLRGARGAWGDFDNDGYLDFFTTAGGGKVLRNIDGKRFEDIGDAFPGLPPEMRVVRSAVWGDFTGNGHQDLYVAGYEIWQKGQYKDVLYANQGDGTLEKIWESPRGLSTRGVTAADYNQDGRLEIYVSNYRLAPNQLWHFDDEGNLINRAKEANLQGDNTRGAFGHTIGSAWGDLDNDGRLDLFVGNFSHAATWQDRSKFMRNQGPEQGHAFEDMSHLAGLRWVESYASPTLGDFDNDGYLDLYLTTVYNGDASVLYRNKGDWAFEEVSGIIPNRGRSTYQAAWGDYNNDGHLDLVTGGRLFRNPGTDNHWLIIRVGGKKETNRFAIGAQARIALGDQILTRQVETTIGEGNHNDMRLHFGLGDHEGPVTLTVRWLDGHEVTQEVEINHIVEINRE